jgi:hypothetical protein
MRGKHRLVFRGREVLESSNLGNIHKLSLNAGISAQTAYKYLQNPENVKSLDLKVLAAILMEGLGLSEKQILDMKVSDLFIITEDNED